MVLKTLLQSLASDLKISVDDLTHQQIADRIQPALQTPLKDLGIDNIPTCPVDLDILADDLTPAFTVLALTNECRIDWYFWRTLQALFEVSDAPFTLRKYALRDPDETTDAQYIYDIQHVVYVNHAHDGFFVSDKSKTGMNHLLYLGLSDTMQTERNYANDKDYLKLTDATTLSDYFDMLRVYFTL